MNILLRLIQDEQRQDGGFPSWSAPIDDWTKGTETYTTFFTSLVLGALSAIKFEDFIDHGALNTVIENGLKFLKSQQSQNWTWNYWQKSTAEAGNFRVPDDLDDTFCAAIAFAKYKPGKLPAEGLASLAKILTASEAGPGGPYKTWIVPKSFSPVWQDIDLAVNCNVARFLKTQKVKLQPLTALIKQAVVSNAYTSPYYPSVYPVIYFLSEACSEEKQVINFLHSQQANGMWGNLQTTALAAISLLNLGETPRALSNCISYLKSITAQEIFPYPFCNDPVQQGKPYAAGCKALTAALVLETLGKYRSTPKRISRGSTSEDSFCRTVASEINENSKTAPLILQKPLVKWVEQILNTDADHKIILTCYWAANCKDAPLVRLAAQATFYGWAAYLLQDRMLDRESGPELIPLSNYFLRQLNNIALKIDDLGFQASSLLSELCQIMDEANCFELVQQQSPADLSKKSIGFAFGPLIIDPKLRVFFQHYLTARQLNDDAHDWEEDWQKGLFNSVGSLLLQRADGARLKELRQIFYADILPKIAAEIIKNCDLAEKESTKFPLLLRPLRKAAEEANSQHKLATALGKLFQNKDRQPKEVTGPGLKGK